MSNPADTPGTPENFEMYLARLNAVMAELTEDF